MIENNNSLSFCAINSLCSFLSINGYDFSYIEDNGPGCSNTSEVIASCTEGLEDSNDKRLYNLYPNPTNGELFVDSKNGFKIVEVIIYNQIGQEVLYNRLMTDKIDVSKLPQGIYTIHLVSDGSRIVKKLIIN